MRENMWHLPCWAWVASLTMIFCSSVHFPEHFLISLFPHGWIKLHCVHIFSSCSSVDGHLGWLHFLAIVNTLAIKIEYLTESFEYIPSITGSYRYYWFQFFWEPLHQFPEWLWTFTFPMEVNKASSLPMFSSEFAVCFFPLMLGIRLQILKWFQLAFPEKSR